mmetsp:Transcript_42318/g.85635  ORF Transcript_42318/g.85635 Transcript_42318/m.85635 type:complete len:253 (-) Transcript_42318:383-1141(-)
MRARPQFATASFTKSKSPWSFGLANCNVSPPNATAAITKFLLSRSSSDAYSIAQGSCITAVRHTSRSALSAELANCSALPACPTAARTTCRSPRRRAEANSRFKPPRLLTSSNTTSRSSHTSPEAESRSPPPPASLQTSVLITTPWVVATEGKTRASGGGRGSGGGQGREAAGSTSGGGEGLRVCFLKRTANASVDWLLGSCLMRRISHTGGLPSSRTSISVAFEPMRSLKFKCAWSMPPPPPLLPPCAPAT